uniref:Sulfotransfer_1 domain-containing protein n=1 Tax=Dracunculus medinensis TaxID=318479 RepID=A0A0N4UK53_DRAME
LPQCLIIGVRKGGTRALLDALALHPNIRVVRRELHFFSNNETYLNGLEWYRQQMPYIDNNLQITIEKTPAYFTNELAAERVYHMNSSIKLIIILRDPVIRTISDFTQVLYTKFERNKSQPIFEAEAFLADGTTINIAYKPIRNSLYSLHMKQWLKHFPLKNFLILNGDRFIIDPSFQIKKVERFLKLSQSIEPSQILFNKKKGFFCFRQKNRHKPRCLGETKGRAHANISMETKLKLRRAFLSYNLEFFKMVNHWWNWN